MNLAFLGLTAAILIWVSLACLPVVRTGNLRPSLRLQLSALSMAQAMPTLGTTVFTQEDQDQSSETKGTPDESAGHAGRGFRHIDPYQEVRMHLLAAVIVIVSVAAAGVFLLLR